MSRPRVPRGAIAQLGERLNGIQEVRGSNSPWLHQFNKSFQELGSRQDDKSNHGFREKVIKGLKGYKGKQSDPWPILGPVPTGTSLIHCSLVLTAAKSPYGQRWHSIDDTRSVLDVVGRRDVRTANKAGLARAGPAACLAQDLPSAVKHLNDQELDLLIAACLKEAKRRGSAHFFPTAARGTGHGLVDPRSSQCKCRSDVMHPRSPSCARSGPGA